MIDFKIHHCLLLTNCHTTICHHATGFEILFHTQPLHLYPLFLFFLTASINSSAILLYDLRPLTCFAVYLHALKSLGPIQGILSQLSLYLEMVLM